MKIELLSLLFLLAIVVDFVTCYQDESQPQSFPGIVEKISLRLRHD